MSDKYDNVVDLSDENNGHTMMIDLIGANKRVLEMGCASGYMSKVLTSRGCTVVGVDADADAAERAREHCADVVVGDIEQMDFTELFGPHSFEVVAFGDVLEHLHDPLAALRKIRPLLTPAGSVVSSIPNVAHGAVRLSLLQGRFDYRPLGLLDDTHLRFFTRDGIASMFEEAGFVVVETRRTTVGMFETEIKLNPDDFDSKLIESLEADPEATTYQFVSRAVIDDGLQAVRELHEREEKRRVEILRLEREVASLRTENESVRDELVELERANEEIARLSSEVERLTAERASALEAAEAVRAELRAHEERWERLERRWPVRLYRLLRRR